MFKRNADFIPGTKAVLATDLQFRGSQVFNDGGEINAASRKDALAMLAQAAKTLSEGHDMVTASEADQREEAAKAAADRREVLEILVRNTPEAREAAAMVGQELAGRVSESVNRTGFTRAVCQFQPLSQGDRPEIRVTQKDAIAAVLAGPVRARLQVVRDHLLYPPEVDITSRIFIEARLVNSTRQDLLGEKYAEAVEHVLVREDRMWKTGADVLISANNQAHSHSGHLTPEALGIGRELVAGYNMPVETMLFSSNAFSALITNRDFEDIIDPVTRLEVLRTGRFGSLYGAALITDGTREPRQKVLERGEVYFVGPPQHVGEYTDRGGVQAMPLSADNTGINGVGWHIVEYFSLGMANFRAVAKLTGGTIGRGTSN